MERNYNTQAEAETAAQEASQKQKGTTIAVVLSRGEYWVSDSGFIRVWETLVCEYFNGKRVE